MPRVIYKPKGRAAEYAEWAVNLFQGCDHCCHYCYGPQALRMTPQAFQEPLHKPQVLARLERDAKDLAGDPKPVLLCFVTDPYLHLDEHTGITRKAIQILHDHNLRVRILTKGGFRSHRDFDLLTDQDFYGTTLTFESHGDSRRWEPYAALPCNRINTLNLAHRLGIPTWVSLEPVIDPAQTLELIRMTHTCVDEYRVGKLNYVPARINWPKFAREVVDLLNELDCTYYIKNDLHKYCPPGTPQRREKKGELATSC